MPSVGMGPTSMADEPIPLAKPGSYSAQAGVQKDSISTPGASTSATNSRDHAFSQQHNINHHPRKRSFSSQGTTFINANDLLGVGVSPRPRMMSHNNVSYSNPTNVSGDSVSPGRFTTNVSDFHLPVRNGIPTTSIFTNSAIALSSNSATSSNNIRPEGEYSVSSASLPLLRRAAAAAAFANASRVRLRRGSMLGREVAKEEDLTSSDEDEDMGSLDDERHVAPLDKSPSPTNNGRSGRARSSSSAAGQLKQNLTEDIMQIETGDVSLENVNLESHSRPSTPPPIAQQTLRSRSNGAATSENLGVSVETGNSFPSAMRGNGGRRGVGRSRGNQTFRDRGMQRVAASLRDEARPSDSEIASEAKLQRKLAPESDSITPNTPRLLAIGARSPTAIKRQQAFSMGNAGIGGTIERNHTVGSAAFEDDEFMFTDHFEPYDGVDSSDEEDFGSSSVKGSSYVTPAEEDGENFAAQHPDGIAIPTVAASSQREKLWLGFREATPVTGLRASPGSERVLGKGRPTTASGPINALSTSFGSPSLDTAMDSEPNVGFTTRSGMTMASPSMWGKTAKRKYDSDRFEPYSTSLHKRRAVSPITIASAGIGGVGHLASTAAALQRQRARSSTPGAAGQSPLLQAISQQQSPLLTIQTNGNGAFNNLPVPTPLSIPSPTLSVTRTMSTGIGFPSTNTQPFSKSLPQGMNAAAANGTSKTNSGMGVNMMPASVVSESPSSTRPSTPTNAAYPLPYYNPSTASPSLLSNSVGKNGFYFNGAATGNNGVIGSTVNVATSTPSTTATTSTAKGGSGPGYGSGALGLSLGSGTSKRFKQEQEEQEEQEDMLDDVNAIKLGEM